MAIKQAAVRIFYHLVGCLIGLARLFIAGALIVTLAPFAFVLTAQLYRWGRTGDWRPVSIDDFLQMVTGRSDPPVSSGEPIEQTLLALPITLALLLAAAAFFAVDLWLKRSDRARLEKLARSRQQEIANEIDRALSTQPEMTD
jgi:hypothetical protein